MFKLFSKQKKSESGAGYEMLRTDVHSHLIPGIDDGAPDMETAIQLVRGMVDLGFSKLVTTPHVMWDMYQNTRDNILTGLDKLREEVTARSIPVEIHAAAEYFLDDYVVGLLKKGEPLLPISGNKVLVEFSMANPSMSLKGILFELQMQGYQPVIAHPERYIYLEGNKEFYDELKDIGCLFQLNLLALTPYYGRSVHELAQYLLKKGYYDIAASDLHHFRHLNALHDLRSSPAFKKLLESGRLINHEL